MTHRALRSTAFLVFAAAAAVSAQTGPPPPTPSTPATVASIVNGQIDRIEKLVTDAAEAMPEGKYGFSPEGLALPGSDYKGVRTFGQQVQHIAASNYAIWWPLTGEEVPSDSKGGNGPDTLKTKADILKFLKDSYALGHRAAATLTAQNATEVPPKGRSPRLQSATFGVAHAYDHYGQMVEYLRMNGIVPPESRGKSN
jgi:hypothetical protein